MKRPLCDFCDNYATWVETNVFRDVPNDEPDDLYCDKCHEQALKQTWARIKPENWKKIIDERKNL